MKIKKATKKDIPILEKYMSAENMPNFHKKKIQEQKKGRNFWFIAWIDNKPVGHIQLRLNGTKHKTVRKYIKNCAHVESLGVKKEYRRKGIGIKLTKYCEKIAKKNKINKIGLMVGETDNPYAKALYKKIGYKDWKHGTFTESWDVLTKGKKKKEKEICIYLFKELR